MRTSIKHLDVPEVYQAISGEISLNRRETEHLDRCRDCQQVALALSFLAGLGEEQSSLVLKDLPERVYRFTISVNPGLSKETSGLQPQEELLAGARV